MLRRLNDGSVVYTPKFSMFGKDKGHGSVRLHMSASRSFPLMVHGGPRWTAEQFAMFTTAQRTNYPQGFKDPFKDRVLWWFHDKLFWENDGLTADQVRALIVDKERRQIKRVERVAAAVDAPLLMPDQRRRDYIPEEVRYFVMERAGHRCERCGFQYELQFDHVIPVARGGSSNAENLQVLCGPCNRAKSSNLV